MSPSAAARSAFAIVRPYGAPLAFLVALGLISTWPAPPGVRAVIVAIAGSAAIVLVAQELARRGAGPASRLSRLEHELAIQNSITQAQLDASPLGILVVDAADRIHSFNGRFVAFFDPPPSFARGASHREMLASFSAATVDPGETFARIRYLYAHPKEIADDEIHMADGRIFERHSVELRPDGDESVGRIWFFHDVTAMRVAARTAQEESNVVSAILDSLPGYFVQIDTGGHLVRWNESLRLLNGLSNVDIMGADPFKSIVEADRPAMSLKIRETILTGAAELEFRINSLTGVRTIHWNGRRILVGGQPQVLAVGLDVTETRVAEERLRASEERFRIIFESVTDGIILQEIETGRYNDVNPRTCEMFGYTREEFLALPAYAISVATPDVARAEMTLIRDNVSGKPRVFDWLCRAKDGRHFWTEISSHTVWFGGHEMFLSTMRDITERRQAASDLSYRERLLHALTLSTAELVKGTSYESSMPRLLEAVGQELVADHLSVVRVAHGEDVRFDKPVVVYRWERPGVPTIDIEEIATAGGETDFPTAINAWLAPLREGKPVVALAAETIGTIRTILATSQILSIAFVPIFAEGKYWGYFSVDDTHTARVWTPVEIEALKTFADVAGALIARQRSEANLLQSEEQFRTVTETVLDGIIMIGIDGRIRFWNPAAERIFGYTSDEARGQLLGPFLSPERFRIKAVKRLAAFFAAGHGPLQGRTVELAAIRKDGTEIAVELAINLMEVGADQYAVGVVRDVTERKRSNGLIEQMASHDALTGLPNRRSFIVALEREIARARRSGETFAVLYLDLDYFKDVNDTLGHPAGDRLLQAVAQRLKASVREVDTVARFGGDEFAAIQSNVREPESAAVLAQKIVRALADLFTLDGNDIQSGTSLGIAIYGPDSPDAESLLTHADVALYLAKSEGRGTYRFYADTMQAEIRAHTALVSDLRSGLAEHQFFLLYEPQVDRSGTIVGLEATVRWQRPGSGIVEPAQFMAAAEKSGLINPLGTWTLREACRQTKLWIDEGIAPPYLAINFSAQQFKVPRNAEDSIAAIVATSGVPPAMLELELRESALTEAESRHNAVLLSLIELGLRITIDDFGNGHSSLDVLRRFPVWRIKIAPNFIEALGEYSSNAPLVRATLSLARELGIPVIAEGVESEAQASVLSAWGCQEMQGPYFARPMAAAETSALLRARTIRGIPSPPAKVRGLSLIYADDGPSVTPRTGADGSVSPLKQT
jgi:diguanylate cyclase (GGDEF)-like protein/PAS domain S-box-containing protein